MTRSNKYSQSKRLELIRQELVRAREVAIDDLAQRFGVSGMTIRRDLELLETRGEVIRTHGGAALAERLSFEFSFRQRRQLNQPQKEAIARAALNHIQDGQIVMLDTGTTTLRIAQELIEKRRVTIITTSLAIVSEVQFASRVEVVLLGGYLRKESPDLHGALAEQNVEKFHSDIAIVGADAIDENGATYTSDLRVMSLDKKMAHNSDKVIIVADSSKFAGHAMCKVLEPDQYDLIITDKGLDSDTAQKLTQNHIKLEMA